MPDFNEHSKEYERMAQAIAFLEANFKRQPALIEAAARMQMSPHYFQRTFKRWVGISPKRYVQFLTKEHAKQLLGSSSLLDASYDSGLSGPSRLHDLFVAYEALTPGQYKEQGRGVRIEYGIHPTPFGQCLIAVTARGICQLSFIDAHAKKALGDLHKRWKNADIAMDQSKTAAYVRRIFRSSKGEPLLVLCTGTKFQLKVWEALLRIPSGKMATYGDIARLIGSPKATRAVGNAVGQNPIAYLIPCHRVIRNSGHLGGYRWGTSRKRAILACELS